MPLYRPLPWEQTALSVLCPHCRAEAGQWCLVRAWQGWPEHPAVFLHIARRSLQEALATA